MALIKCSECGKEINDKAKVCVNCGCPIETLTNNKNHKEQNDSSIRIKTSNNKYYEKEINIKTVELDFEKIKSKKNICIFFIVSPLLVIIWGGFKFGIIFSMELIPLLIVIVPFIIMFFNFKGFEKMN